jgi:hypothetical protein
MSRVLRNAHYKWIALSNTTLGGLMAAMNASIILIALPAIFRGIGVNPLEPAEITPASRSSPWARWDCPW